MKNHYLLKFFVLIITLTNYHKSFCQENLPIIKYDIATESLLDKLIPFDQAFKLKIEKFPKKNVLKVFAFQTSFKKGQKEYIFNNYIDCDGKSKNSVIMDYDLPFKMENEDLLITFPALKPGVHFDIHIITELDIENKKNVMSLNTALAEGKTGENEFKKASKSTLYKKGDFQVTYFKTSIEEYKKFYEASLKKSYDAIKEVNNFSITANISEREIQGIDAVLSKNISDSSSTYLLFEVSRRDILKGILLGTRDINNSFLVDNDKIPATIASPEIRKINLESNIKYFEALQKKVTKILSKGILLYDINGSQINFTDVKNKIDIIRGQLQTNYDLIFIENKKIDKAISEEDKMQQLILFSNNTEPLDLKAAGGRILFLDAGFANIIAADLNDKATYIPKLYMGVSIYFRSIDKNTRQGTFFSDFVPEANNGCKNNKYGPDYGIVSRWSIWQHLCLNIGITFGNMGNKDFDNFYNSNSLLIGPAYRFARAFKVSSGVALLKRSSTNPIISDKCIIPAAYLSLSVDIDFIDSIKSVTNSLFK